MKQEYVYERAFIITSSHFNSAREYAIMEELEDSTRNWDNAAVYERMLSCIANTHGHNFLIALKITALSLNTQGFVIDDQEVEQLIRGWDRKNLSVHPDFKGKRATTEVMAELLAKKLAAFANVDYGGLWTEVTVMVQETGEICATHTIKA